MDLVLQNGGCSIPHFFDLALERQHIHMSNQNIPQHIAIILDGNGRWAESKNMSRSQGHVEGVKRVEEIVEAARLRGVKVLTLYTFSTENWTRPPNEVSMIMKIFCAVLDEKVKKLMKDNIRFHSIGRRDGVPSEVRDRIDWAIEQTKDNTGLVVNIAFNYGARVEIVDAIKNLAAAVKEGKLKVDDINEGVVSEALYTQGLPDPDLLIRTSGEKRISNFLLWQLSYAELYFTEKNWPEFDRKEFEKAIEDYQARERRFGNVSGRKENLQREGAEK
jgi:undecaprenyl diphosphate synthase